MAAIGLDRTGFPLLVVTYPDHYSVAELEAHFVELRALLAEGRAYVMVQDLRASGLGDDAVSRNKGTAFMREVEEQTTRLCRGTALVVGSKIIRLALQGIFALTRPAYPYVILENMDEAMRWARQKAWDTHPLPVTPKLAGEHRVTSTARSHPTD